MAFTVYKSTDASAPVLSGSVGTLVTVLDNCLVTGYGSQTAAGWSKPFTGTNKAAFRPGSGNQLYLRVQDDAPGLGGAREARLTGYETMSDVDTGTGPFPTALQGVGGVAMLVARKSNTADATARAWVLVADARTFYMFVFTADGAGIYRSFAFGEFYSLVSADAYNTMLIGRNAENSTAAGADTLDLQVASVSSTTSGHYMARGHTQLGGSVNFGVHGDLAKNGNSTLILGIVPFTNPADGGVFLSPLWVHDSITAPTSGLRGRMRGFWQLCHPVASVGDQETLVGTGELAGRTFMFLKTGPNGTVYTIETSNTLETN